MFNLRALLVALCMLALAACGGGDDTYENTSGSGSSSSSSSDSEPPDTENTGPTDEPGSEEPNDRRSSEPLRFDVDDYVQLDGNTDQALMSDNQAGQVDYTATYQYLEATILHADRVWSNWFATKNFPEPWVGYEIIMPGEVYHSNCTDEQGNQEVTESNHPNAYYCDYDMNQSDRGYIVFPVETMAKMWTGNVFERQVSDLKQVGDFAAGIITAHEFGHHVVHELSEVTQVPMPPNPNSELIADCFAGVWTFGLDIDRLLEPGDVDEALNALEIIGDNTGSHGTGEERKNAYLIGATGSQADPRGGVPENCLAAYWPEIMTG